MINPLKTPKLFHSNAYFKYLWMARLVSLISDTFILTALILLLAEKTESGVQVGLLLLMQTLPRMFGPFLGTIVDRFAQRNLMIYCEVGKIGILFAFLFFLNSTQAILFLLVVKTALSSVHTIAGRSVLPSLVNGDEIAQANALFGMGLGASLALAPASAGVLYQLLGARGSLLICALILLLSIGMLRRLPVLSDQGEAGSHSGYFNETRSGLRYLLDQRGTRIVTLGLFLTVVFAAVGSVSLVFLVQDVLGGSPASYGYIQSIYGAGMVVAPLLFLPWIEKTPPGSILLTGMGLTGIGLLFTGFAPIISLVFLAQTVGGMGNGLQNLANDSFIQKTVPRRMLGRTFGSVYSAAHLAAAIAYIVGGAFLDLTSTRFVFITAGAGVLLSTGIVHLLLMRMVYDLDEAGFGQLNPKDELKEERLAVKVRLQ